MMSRIGNELPPLAQPVRPRKRQIFSVSGGFTLIEVMAAAMILALGMVIIFEVFLVSLDTMRFFDTRISAQWLVNEKMWAVQDLLDQPLNVFMPQQQSGTVMFGTTPCVWQVTLTILDTQQEVYRLDAQASWQQGRRQCRVRRVTMAKRNFSNVPYR